jgi:hypothetical protein
MAALQAAALQHLPAALSPCALGIREPVLSVGPLAGKRVSAFLSRDGALLGANRRVILP